MTDRTVKNNQCGSQTVPAFSSRQGVDSAGMETEGFFLRRALIG